MDRDVRKSVRVVFGTGICMQNHWRLISKYFYPDYFSDNGSDKWYTYPMGNDIECVPPDFLKDFVNPEVLVAVGDPYSIQAIQKQLKDMGIESDSILDFMEQWGAHEQLPHHLKKIEFTNDRKRILLFNTPEHDNVGDHLISISELNFIKKALPEYEYIEITDLEYLWFRKRLYQYVQKEDIVLITGGGFLGSLWLYNGELNVRDIITNCPDNKIIILPQTLYFENNSRGEKELKKTMEVYGKSKNLTICLRDKNSYELANKLWGGAGNKIRYFPDMALFMNYSFDCCIRKGALLCFRKDKESVMEEFCKQEVEKCMDELGLSREYISMHTGKTIQFNDRETEIKKKIIKIKSAAIVVTDTLHCMILCAISGTPCLVFDNLSQKVSGVYEWIKNLSYIKLYDGKIHKISEYIRTLVGSGQKYDNSIFIPFYEELAKLIAGE